MWREKKKKKKKKTGIRADTNFFDESTCRPWLDPDQIFSSLARHDREYFFFVASSPRRKAFSEGRLLHTPYIHTSHVHTHTYRVSTHKQLSPSPSLASEHLAWQAFFPCVHGPFSLGVGIISLPWFQNTIISGKAYIRTLRSTHVPRSHIFFFFFFFFKIFFWQVEMVHITPCPRLPNCKATTLHLYACAPLSFIIIVHDILWRI